MSLIVKEPAKKAKASPYTYAWVMADTGLLSLTFDENEMCLYEEAGLWIATATIDGKRYRAARQSLEDAAKAADRLLYKKFPHVWTQTDARAIISPWKGDLNP
jgi:hypothetical protein